jgi:hypothetical protein
MAKSLIPLGTHEFIIRSGGWAIVAYTLDDLVRELKAIDLLVDSTSRSD